MPGNGAADFGAMEYIDLVEGREPKLRPKPNGSKELAVAESFSLDFGTVEVPTKGSLTWSIGFVVSLTIAKFLSLPSSGEKEVNLVSGVPSVDSPPP